MARKKSIDGAYDPAEVARLYASGMTQRAVGAAVGLSQSSAGDVLRKLGVESRAAHGPRRYRLDEAYFDVIDTPEKAYWLGFIAADGGIMPKSYGLAVHLGPAERPHLMKLAAALGSDGPIERSKTGLALRFHSRRLAAALAPHGVVPRKSYCGTPWRGPAHLMPHYWRGLIDGDGHISKTRAYIALAGTQAVTQAFADFATGVCGTRAKPRPQTHGAAWQVMVVGARKVPVLVRALYEIGGPSLDRKKAAAIALVERHPARVPVVCRICGVKAVAREFCGKHYQRWAQGVDPRVDPQRPRGKCAECGARVAARGLCGRHYMAAKRRDALPPLPRRAQATPGAPS